MNKTLTRTGLGAKGNVIVDTVKYIKKEVGAVQTKIENEAKAIAIRNMILGGAIGIVVGIIGTTLWEKYTSQPAVTPRSPQV